MPKGTKKKRPAKQGSKEKKRGGSSPRISPYKKGKKKRKKGEGGLRGLQVTTDTENQIQSLVKNKRGKKGSSECGAQKRFFHIARAKRV